MLISRLQLSGDPDSGWAYRIPAVREIAERGLEFTRPVTFLVGENGSGKSTIVEAIAEAYGINPRGGRGKAYRRSDAESPLTRDIEFDFTDKGAEFFGRKKRSRSVPRDLLRARSVPDGRTRGRAVVHRVSAARRYHARDRRTRRAGHLRNPLADPRVHSGRRGHRAWRPRLRSVRWDQLEVVANWRRYLTDPTAYLRHLIPLPPTENAR